MRVISEEQWKMIPKEIQDQLTPPAQTKDNKKIVPQVFPIVRDFHTLIGEHLEEGDSLLFFGVDVRKCGYQLETDIFSLLVNAGCFKSKNEARKNWRGIQEMPKGYFEIGPIGKSKIMIYGLNAI